MFLEDYISIRKLMTLCMDLIVIVVSFLLPLVCVFGFETGVKYILDDIAALSAAAAVFIVALYSADMYYIMKNFRRFSEIIRVLLCALAASAVLLAFSRFGLARGVDTAMVVSMASIMFLGVFANRVLLNFFIDRSLFIKNAVILGSNDAAVAMCELINQTQYTGMRVVGFINDRPDMHASLQKLAGIEVLGSVADIKTILGDNDIKLVIVSLSGEAGNRLAETLLRFKQQGIHVIGMPTLYERIAQRTPVRYIDIHWLLDSCLSQNKFSTIRIKRLADIVISAMVLVLSLPFTLILAALIKLDSRGPVFYLQERLGKDGRPFAIIKFRSMHVGSDRKKVPIFARRRDARLTRVGRILRKFRLDELPQFINVLTGDMSVIGPRPEWRDFVRDIQKKIPLYKLRLTVRPGITGWAQVNYKHTVSLEEYITKYEYDLYYIKNMSVLLDMTVFVRTFGKILSGGGK